MPHNLLVLSDVHLGSDLVHCARPHAPPRDAASERRDLQLVALLDWYREHPQHGRPWRLVFAGDLVDFVGMSVVPPGSGIHTPPTEEDVEFGLGAAEDHTLYKLRCVARRHAPVFESVARFVAAGNTLVVVRGNHDVDFHWPTVQDEFVRQLALHAPIERGRVEFCPWFYYEEGRVYVEHGHQYDRYCSYEHVLNPVSPSDPRRSSRSLSDVMLRHVVRPTRGLVETGHEGRGFVDYLAFAAGLGLSGMVGLGTRFFRAVTTLLGMWRAHFGEGAERLRRHHERRLENLAALLDMKIESLKALLSLQRPPVTKDLVALSLTVMLDKILFGAVGVLAAGIVLAITGNWEHAVGVAVGTGLLTVLVSVVIARARRDIEPSRELRDGAARVARLFPAAFVVMGHTHMPEVHGPAGAPTTYVNLGAWADAEGEDGKATYVASRTHLVMCEEADGCPVAELLVWDAETGPRRFVSPASSSTRG